jgi:hypothetical protein
VGGWMDGWMAGKAGLRIAYSNQKLLKPFESLTQIIMLQCLITQGLLELLTINISNAHLII